MIIAKDRSVYSYINEIHLRMSDFGYATGGPEWSSRNVPYSMHSRLWYIISGNPYVVANGVKTYLKPGNCYLLPTGFRFGYSCDSRIEQLYFHINLNDPCGIDMLRSYDTLMEYTPDEGDIQAMKKYILSDLVTDAFKLKELLYRTLNAFFEKHEIHLKGTHYSLPVASAISYIQTHLSARLKVSDVAANSFTSVSTLTHKFKKETQMTIGDFIDNSVMYEAELLVRQTDIDISEISNRFEFSDNSYFSRKFRKVYGMSPNEYRKNRIL